jgi:bifunctional non-homologous end joining protein LigD
MTRTPKQLLRHVFPPMLATLVGEPPANDSDWAYELKYDGFRAITAITNGEMAIWSRNELDLIPRFPRVAEAMAKMGGGLRLAAGGKRGSPSGIRHPASAVVLDGEIVAEDEKGVPRFQLLQGGRNREKMIVFDVLWLDGEDLRKRPYSERRAILEKLLRRAPAGVEVAQTLDMSGIDALHHAAVDGWEGIIAKRRTSVYEGRRSKEWVKVKALNEQELAVIGYTLSTATTREIGALHLGYLDDSLDDRGAMRYAGKVGTGFSSKLRVELRDRLAKDEVPSSPAIDAPRLRDAHWVKPRLVAQVAFTEWTTDNKLRHPSFLGLRDDKKPEEVVREQARGSRLAAGGKKQAGGKRLAAGGEKRAGSPQPAARGKKDTSVPPPAASRQPPAKSRVTLTHPERILYPKDKLTKADVLAYYEAMSEPLIKALHDRPLSLEHWNQGVGKPSWFHQNLGREAPDWLSSVDTPTRVSSRGKVKHLTIDNVDDVRWLAQMSVLTIHMWASRAPKLEQADWLVFDLDPAKGKGIEQAIEAAIVMRGLLEHLELPSVPKTSGKRGIHVFVPLAPGYMHEQAAEFACSIAAAVTREVPTMTVERSLAKRRGRLYLDCMQNAYGKTIVAPYSPRGIDGAPVSAPLKWEEVTKKLDPLKYNIRTMPDRYAKVGDLFEPVLKKGAKLPDLT